MTATLYGIKTCDTIRKARAWLDGKGVDYRFHDYRVEGIDEATLRTWVAEHGWETILNRASTTFRDLPQKKRAGLDAGKAIALMLAEPTMIKRPVLQLRGKRLVGFKPELYAAAFR